MSEALAFWLTAGVLIQQVLSLAVVREKLRQVVCKARRTEAPRSSRWASFVEALYSNFLEVLMGFLLVVSILTGVFFIVFQHNQGAFVEAKALSAVVILAANFVAGIRIAIERFKTELECV